MENEIKNMGYEEEEGKINNEIGSSQQEQKDGKYILPASIIFAGVIIAGAMIYGAAERPLQTQDLQAQSEEAVLPSDGIVLPVAWGDLGSKLVSVGAIDSDKFIKMYEEREIFTKEYRDLLLGQNNQKLKITGENSGYLLNLFWALGLASKNPILDSGEMTDPKYGGAQRFASTAGWTLAQSNPMDHYSRHLFFELTADQQALVDKVSRGIYRPCCGNSTHFPDCNHGMAMLGLLELMASQGVSEKDMWDAALAVNAFWFPDTYLTIAIYMEDKGILWEKVNPKEILGAAYSSASGYQKIMEQVKSRPNQGGGGCSV